MRFIHTPAQGAKLALDYARFIKKHKGVNFGIPSMDKVVIPMLPGEVSAFVGRPGNGKSAFLNYLAKNTAEQTQLTGTPVNEANEGDVVLYVTWEQMIEVQEFSTQASSGLSISDIMWGRADIDELTRISLNRPKLPIWIAGRSFYDAGKKKEPMYVDVLMDEIIEARHQFDINIRLICFDYLQKMPVRKGQKKYDVVCEAINNTSELAKECGCPIALGVQAKSSVDKSDDKIPTLGDAYYGTELDHVIDKGFGLVKPIKFIKEGDNFPMDMNGSEVNIEVTHNTFLMKMFKQRGDIGFAKFALDFNMATMQINDLVSHHLDLSEY